MLDSKDLYIYQIVSELKDKDSSNDGSTKFGTVIISYEIRRYRDIRNLSEDFTYQVFCTQRIVVPNGKPYSPGVDSSSNQSFDKYPAILSSQIATKKLPSGTSQWLVDYTPRTINASVNLTSSQGGQSGSTSTVQNSSGSTLTQSNTYGASASAGFWGADPTGSISISASHESGQSKTKTSTTGTENNVSSVTSTGDNYSVKDWASYAYTDDTNSTINWVWGQEYPWNVLQYRHSESGGNSGDNEVTLPDFVKDQLYDADGGILLPPSMLSQFGIDFSMKAAWLISFSPNPSSTKVKFDHNLALYTATHKLDNSDSLSASINSPLNSDISTSNIDLCLYGLDLITESGATSSAVVGFLPSKYLVQPQPFSSSKKSAANFRILSLNNNLLIEDITDYSSCGSGDDGAGFSAADTALLATFTQNCQSLTFQVSFKVIDTVSDYYLYFKHWILDSEEVLMTITVNGDTDNTFVKLVNAQEAEGGQNNILEIALRHLNFGSIDYHDHLQLGINTVQVQLVPNNPKIVETAGYQLRALSVEAK